MQVFCAKFYFHAQNACFFADIHFLPINHSAESTSSKLKIAKIFVIFLHISKKKCTFAAQRSKQLFLLFLQQLL